MKLTFILIALLFAFGCPVSRANTPPLGSADHISSTLFIAASSSMLAGGRAGLVVGPLNRDDSAYVGDYRIRVSPYFFKNESGRLFINVSEASLRQMLGGLPTNFKGHATTDGTGQTRGITAKAVPSANDHGALTFTVATENGPLVFNTSYRIGKR